MLGNKLEWRDRLANYLGEISRESQMRQLSDDMLLRIGKHKRGESVECSQTDSAHCGHVIASRPVATR